MKTEIKVYRNDDGLWLRFISKTGQEASLNVEEMANKHGGGIISSAIKRTCGELATAYENRGIDYTKDNVYDAIGRPDLKPKEDNDKR